MPTTSTTLAAAATLATGAALTSAFVQPGAPRGPALRRAGQADVQDLAGPASAPEQANLSSPLLLGAACTGVVATAASAGGAKRRGARTVVRATDAAPAPFNPANQVGAVAPFGFFDPAGFCKAGDEDGFKNLRAAEIKHGRVAMMAAVGATAQHFLKLPGFEKVPAGMGAVTTDPGSYGFAALFVISGVLELLVWTQDPKKEGGNFGDPLGLGMYTEDMRNKELNNGRFAMFAALGIVAADLLTGKDAVQQLGL